MKTTIAYDFYFKNKAPWFFKMSVCVSNEEATIFNEGGALNENAIDFQMAYEKVVAENFELGYTQDTDEGSTHYEQYVKVF